jgi:ABC-type branched-subunit amino acid transport system substrate-binding protein
MNAPPNSPHTRPLSNGTKSILIIVSVLCILGCIWNFWVTISIIGIFVALFQIDGFRSWFFPYLDHFLNSLPLHTGNVIKGTKWGAKKVRERGHIVILIILIVFFMKDYILAPSFFQDTQKQVSHYICIQHEVISCGNGLYVTPMQINGNSMNVGIIDYEYQDEQNKKAWPVPFNQLDNRNDDAERKVEKLIFQENIHTGTQPYVTLIVATTLSQTMSDPGISSSAGLDTLRGAHMAQYNYNHNPANDGKPRLHLLIANFGTKDAASSTVPQVIDQIKLYAESEPQQFIGVVGFPFSKLVTYALDERNSISSTDIPIITSAAEANSFTDDSTDTPPTHFYDNFYSIAPPVSDDSQVLTHFIQNHLLQSSQQAKTAVFVDIKDPYSNDLSRSIIQALGEGNKERYTVGQTDQFDSDIADVIKNGYNQIFFAGYADDFNILRNKLKANPATQNIPIIGGEGLYYPYPSIYDNSGNTYNFAKLFFTTDASYAQINPHFSGYIPKFSCSASSASLIKTAFNDEFCHWFYHANPPGAYGYALPGFHVLLIYDAVTLFLKAWDQRDKTFSPYWQAIDKQLPVTPFDGISGHIQYTASTSFHPISKPTQFKPIYIACTDDKGNTHIVAGYHIEHQTLSDPGVLHEDSFSQNEENMCTNGSTP